jgi:hypothetical protein
MKQLIAMIFESEPVTPVRNALLNTEQRINNDWATLHTPQQQLDYFTRLGSYFATNIAALQGADRGTTPAGGAGAQTARP